jgi:type IV secretory pathway VirB2 component (pilin)
LPWRHFYAALGVIITGIAVSFGSSFWFALLQRLVGLRGGAGASSG